MNVLIVASLWPEPSSSAAGRRMMDIIKLFHKQGWKLTYACTAAESEFRFPLESLGIDLHTVKINDGDFDVFIKALAPELVLFDRFMVEEQFSWRVAEQCPEAFTMLETSDLHCLRKSRELAVKAGQKFKHEDLMNDISFREVASIQRTDLSLIISSVEMSILEEVFKVNKALLHYWPFIVEQGELRKIKAKWPSFMQREGFISIGNFKHEPNWDSVKYLKNEVWPLIRQQLPKAKLSVYGAYPPPKALQLNKPQEGFFVRGRADDAQQIMLQAKVCLAPLRFGAGLKGKLLEAMECGTASVTTDVGAEGMHANLPWSGRVEDEPQALADAAVEIHNNEALWLTCQQNGLDIMAANFSPLEFEPALITRIKQLKGNLAAHRQQNFQGAMLRHHTMRSTKYMSLWIEEKNK